METPRPEWAALQVELFSGESWIADGNYGGTFDVRFKRADTVIILALPRLTCVASALRRSFRHHGVPVQAPGCPERFDPSFLRWIWRYDTDSRPRLDAASHRHRNALDIVELRSRRQVDDYLNQLS